MIYISCISSLKWHPRSSPALLIGRDRLCETIKIPLLSLFSFFICMQNTILAKSQNISVSQQMNKCDALAHGYSIEKHTPSQMYLWLLSFLLLFFSRWKWQRIAMLKNVRITFPIYFFVWSCYCICRRMREPMKSLYYGLDEIHRHPIKTQRSLHSLLGKRW